MTLKVTDDLKDHWWLKKVTDDLKGKRNEKYPVIYI
jgi:hypothetical protein